MQMAGQNVLKKILEEGRTSYIFHFLAFKLCHVCLILT